MQVLVTGALGRVGTAFIDHATGDYNFRYLDRGENPGLDVIDVDVGDYEGFRDAASSVDAIVHLAAASRKESPWLAVLESNIIGGYNCFEIARQAEIEQVVLASSNRVVGMYEQDHAPELYEPDYDLLLDDQSPVRPDSYYATSKVFNEALGRYYVENYEFPKQVYAVRFASVRAPRYDHPYGDAEIRVDRGEFERGSKEYKAAARRLHASWQSRRDAAGLIEASLKDDSVEFEIFYGVSDNAGRWFDIEYAKETVGYESQDSAEDWSGPPPGGTRNIDGELASQMEFNYE